MLQFMIMCLFTLPFTIIAMGNTLQAGSNSSSSIGKPGCQTKCGNMTVPYPFGIGEDCSLNDVFYLTCYESSDSDKTPQLLINGERTTRTYNLSSLSYQYLRKLRIHSISDSELRIFSKVSVLCYQQDGNISSESNYMTDLYVYNNRIFTLSEKNKFTVIGCHDRGLITDQGYSSLTSGCSGFCNTTMDMPDDGQCSGKGCCQTSITKGLSTHIVTIESMGKSPWYSNRCSYAFVGEEGSFEFHGIRDLSNNASEVVERIESTVPVVLDWVIATNRSCSEATECKGNNSECYDVAGGGGYRCRCKQGYEGNPYLDSGCQDINECRDRETYPCFGKCINTHGGFKCTCPSGYVGDAKAVKGCQRDNRLIFILGIGLALPIIVIGLLGLYFMAQKRKLLKLREKYYEKNGGALLKDKLKTKGGVDVSSINIFRVEELKKATDNFAKSNEIGKGGNGIVYKGTLTDRRFVAIKKSQRVDEEQREQFINEMVILTQINHINVVQLIGFCLETEVPLLAYEFVSNGTLHHHIHNGKTRRLSWDTRLRIAHESAGALAYLHTDDARMSIIHRDVKSTNILLDENYTAKIADFGASRLVPLGHDEVTTLVQGTLGYLDPEYFHTGHLTDRSDVYSFGVVLAELLTGQPPLNMERCPEERTNLATIFLKAVKEDNFRDILEDSVVKEAGYEQLKAISDLVCRCLNLAGGNRPSMKEVTMELDTLRKLGKPTNWVSEDNYNEMSSLMIEMEPTDPCIVPLMHRRTPRSDTFSGTSITSEMQDMMRRVQSAR